MSVPSGATLSIITQGGVANDRYVRFALYGTFTAADFTIDASDGLGFTPKYAKVVNLTDKTTMEAWFDSGLGTSNAEGLKTIADGTRTYEAHGLTAGDRTLGIDVDVTLVTTNDDHVIEIWG